MATGNTRRKICRLSPKHLSKKTSTIRRRLVEGALQKFVSKSRRQSVDGPSSTTNRRERGSGTTWIATSGIKPQPISSRRLDSLLGHRKPPPLLSSFSSFFSSQAPELLSRRQISAPKRRYKLNNSGCALCRYPRQMPHFRDVAFRTRSLQNETTHRRRTYDGSPDRRRN